MKTINEEFLKQFETYDKHCRPNPEEPLEVAITLLVQSRNHRLKIYNMLTYRRKEYVPYDMAHIIWPIRYGPYDMAHMI